MLYGLLLPSGNDAAVALAQHVSGSVGAFVASMNQEAARLGLGCTHYTSPSGYFNARNYSCAADLAELAHVDLEQPLIAHIARTEKAVEPLPIKGGKVYLYNNNPLLVYGYPGATGLKTGYTELAGDCLVGNRRAPRREVGRGAPALPRTGTPGRVPAGPGLRGRVRPGADPRATGAGRPVNEAPAAPLGRRRTAGEPAENLAGRGDSETAGVVCAPRGVALLPRH